MLRKHSDMDTEREEFEESDELLPTKKVLNEDEDIGKSTPFSDELIDEGIEALPFFLRAPFEKVKPTLYFVGDILDRMSPCINKTIEITSKIINYLTSDSFSQYSFMLVGICMMLFGGYFTMIISVVESVRICGYDSMKKGFMIIWKDYTSFRKKSERDDELDENNDGIADVLQISKKELVSRKLKILTSSVDMDALQIALSGIYTGLVAVFSTLRMQLARSVSLGGALGDSIKPLLDRFILGPTLRLLVPKSSPYRKLVPMIIGYICKTIGLIIALSVNRLISSVHSAFRGANIFLEGVKIYSQKTGLGSWVYEGYYDEFVAIVIALIGLYLQLSTWFSLPTLLYIALFPAVFIESALEIVVAYDVF